MIRLASSTGVPAHPRLDRLLLTSALALVLISLPATVSTNGPVLDWQTALAKSDHANGGNAGGNGKGRGRGGRGVGHGLDDEDVLYRRGHGQDKVGGPADPHDFQEFFDGVRSGKAFGLEKRDERIAAARGRYQEALGKHQGDSGPDEETNVACGFSVEETTTLIERGWQGPKTGDGNFRNHGERVRTMVELAKQLDLDARVGAMQANFGTPFENGIAQLQDELDAARANGADDDEIQDLEDKRAAAIRDAKPGNGPDDSWETVEDLDVNGDQVVDQRDLEAARQSADAEGGDEEQLAEETQ
jgi:hypothetical protein